MGSGNFPVTKQSDIKLWERLEKVKDELIKIWSKMRKDAEDNCQFDDAAEDGGYCERVFIAYEMIKAVMGERNEF